MSPVYTHQPEFAENIVAAIQAEVSTLVLDGDLVVVRPDYNQPLGLLNLYRTSMYIGQPGIAPENYIAHLSNILYGDKHDTMVVVFEYYPGTEKSKTVTKHYVSPTKMALKEHPCEFIGMRSNVDVYADILNFIIKGETPA